MRIAVIGTGNIGGTLGRAWAKAGHDVVLGSRHPQDVDGEGPPVAAVETALEGAEVVLLALPGGAVAGFLADHGAALDGALVIDATNQIGAPVVNAADAVAAAAPAARYVRAFNTYGWENFARPTFGGVAADLFFSAPEADRAAVERLVTDLGLNPAYLGAGSHELVDKVLPLWLALMRSYGDRHVALRVLHD